MGCQDIEILFSPISLTLCVKLGQVTKAEIHQAPRMDHASQFKTANLTLPWFCSLIKVPENYAGLLFLTSYFPWCLQTLMLYGAEELSADLMLNMLPPLCSQRTSNWHTSSYQMSLRTETPSISLHFLQNNSVRGSALLKYY